MKTPLILLFFLATLSLASVQAEDAATAPKTPTQSQIGSLIDQGLNVIQWATADLQKSVPLEIRSNVVALTEDLKDESKKASADCKEAYSKGVRLCSALIEVLDERDQKATQAGFRAAEANARKGVTSQSLEAKRNYRMSWPQFAREQAERYELKGQAESKAEILKARPLADWAERAVFLRKSLDLIYAEFREAVRKSPIDVAVVHRPNATFLAPDSTTQPAALTPTFTVHPHIGESYAEMTKRFGQWPKTEDSRLPGTERYRYQTDAFLAAAMLRDGKVVMVILSRKQQGQRITDQELNDVMNANREGSDWAFDKKANKWIRSDHKIEVLRQPGHPEYLFLQDVSVGK